MNQPESRESKGSHKNNNMDNQTNSAISSPNFTNQSKHKGLFYVVIGLMLVLGVALGTVIGKNWEEINTHFQQDKINANKNSQSNTDKGNTDDSPESPVLTVEVLSPKISQVASNILADGIITAKNTASVSSKVNGMAIESIRVEEGQWVNKGDILATFDAKTLRQSAVQAEANVRQAEANVKQSEASVVQSKVNLDKAQADLNRVLPLLKIGAVSEQQVDSYRAQLEQSKAGLAAAIQAVASAKEAVVSARAQFNNQTLNLMDTQLLAPVSGVISQKMAQVGAMPQGTLFTIIEEGQLEWQADLNPEKVRQLKIGSPVSIQVADNKKIQGTVIRIDPVANNNRQIPVYVRLQSTQGLQSGMLLTGNFITGVNAQPILPVSAITSNDGYDYVMTVTDIKTSPQSEEQSNTSKQQTTGRVRKLKVELGRQENNAVVINSQLPSNTLVVRQSGSFLSDGDLVRVVTLGDK